MIKLAKLFCVSDCHGFFDELKQDIILGRIFTEVVGDYKRLLLKSTEQTAVSCKIYNWEGKFGCLRNI